MAGDYAGWPCELAGKAGWPRCRAGDEAGERTRDARGLNAGASGCLLAAGRDGSEPLAALRPKTLFLEAFAKMSLIELETIEMLMLCGWIYVLYMKGLEVSVRRDIILL
jgi:hypothetical protein